MISTYSSWTAYLLERLAIHMGYGFYSNRVAGLDRGSQRRLDFSSNIVPTHTSFAICVVYPSNRTCKR